MTLELSERAQLILDREFATGAYTSTSEVVEAALRNLASKREREETIQAIREGVADADAGRTASAEEVFEQIYRKHPNLRADK